MNKEKEKLERCGMCGDFLQDPRLYSEKEQSEARLVYCMKCGTEANQIQERVVTRDMAIDAGDRSLEGQSY